MKSEHVLEAGPRGAGRQGVSLRTVVAFDGSSAGSAAVRVAASLAAADRITPTLLSVREEPLSVGAPMPSAADVANALVGDEGEQEWLRNVKSEVSSVSPEAASWPVRFGYGYTAEGIDNAAVVERADLIIMGLNRHNWVGRAIKVETTLEVVRRDHVSVLGIVPGLDHMPRCIVVGTDFSQASHRAARLAAQLLAPGGRLLLVYAEPMFNYDAEDREGSGLIHDEGVHAGFTRMTSGLQLPDGATVEARNIDALAKHALLRVAKRETADLIAIGRQHHSRTSLALFGSTTNDLVRDAGMSLLVTRTAPWTPRPSV